MDINLKCEILKRKSMEMLNGIEEQRKIQQKEYDKLTAKRHEGIDVDSEIKEYISKGAYLHNEKFTYEDIIKVIEFLQDENKTEFKRINIKE